MATFSTATRSTATVTADVDAVWDRVVDGDVRYRAVIDTSTLTG